MLKIHHWYLLSLIPLVLLISFGSRVYAIHCNEDTQCNVTNRICADCVSRKPHTILYPSCTSGICIGNQCGILKPCSLQLQGNCTAGGGCILDPVCKQKCPKKKGPRCSTARCFDGRCAYIAPCQIQLQ